ncbi:MAG: efflux RND transporter periplasmic adaptor subunit [Alphaproteobacteria bacterium]|nr:efflux RND transporter periplasmic adaptor subunit [Alphaproteobacteria bacterium]MCW5744023.1 efflux RND transporter periplasmic adaptor subunit [Alphaproteobacteria bacterium]
MRIRLVLVLVATALLAAAAVLFFIPSASQVLRAVWPSGPGWEAVSAEVPAGKAVRLEVRLTGLPALPPADSVRLTSTRLDMAPDGMAAMTAPLRALPSPAPGVVAFETDLSMAGRWALSLSAEIAGQSRPVRGTVIFRAADGAAPAEAKGGARRIVYYRNPMGAPDISKTPKKDSMGMDYIPVYEDEVSGPPGTLRIAPEKVQRAGVRTGIVGRRPLTRTVRAYGTIEHDERRQAVLTAKFDGFVEELLVPLTGADVTAGQPLARIWVESREILQKQSDYAAALRGGRPADLERAAANLRQFDIPEAVFETLRRTGEPVRSLTINASMGGTVLERPALNGMRFTAGMTLFRIADLSVVWAMARVAERDLPAIAVGQSVRVMPSGTVGEPIEGRVDFVYHDLDAATRTGLVRIELANRERRLRIGQYADIAIATGGGRAALVVPDSAVIDSGTRRVAFVVRGEGLFEARDLVLGRRGDGFVEVLVGLAEGERIVVTGNFLIDAESNLRAAIGGLTAPGAPQ